MVCSADNQPGDPDIRPASWESSSRSQQHLEAEKLQLPSWPVRSVSAGLYWLLAISYHPKQYHLLTLLSYRKTETRAFSYSYKRFLCFWTKGLYIGGEASERKAQERIGEEESSVHGAINNFPTKGNQRSGIKEHSEGEESKAVHYQTMRFDANMLEGTCRLIMLVKFN